MTLAETVAEIKRQGGLVYVPHPFDRMHAVPDYEHLLDDHRGHRRDRGLQPARRDRLVQRGGRSASPPSTASSRARDRTRTSRRASAPCACGCPTSTGPRSSSRRCATAEITTKPSSLLYVQALKFLETKATPAERAPGACASGGCGGRRASRDARAGSAVATVETTGRACRRPTTRSARSTSSARSAS